MHLFFSVIKSSLTVCILKFINAKEEENMMLYVMILSGKDNLSNIYKRSTIIDYQSSPQCSPN